MAITTETASNEIVSIENHNTTIDDDKLADQSVSSELSIIIVSGPSGSGKTSVTNALEDFGYYSIDNLPLSLLVDAVETLRSDTQICKIALGVDIRTPKADLSCFVAVYNQLQEKYGHKIVKILYVTASEHVLIARFDATRRVHPLMTSMHPSLENINNLPCALSKEAEILQPISTHADITIDTSKLNIHQLKSNLREHLGIDNKVTINILSFGFKHGIPVDSDFVFDVRILPNPHWEEGLRIKTGLDTEVHEFFSRHPEVDDMATDTLNYLSKWLPMFLDNNRYTVTIAIGCTGGKHRSVYISEMVARELQKNLPVEMPVVIKHREKKRWQS